MGTGCGICRRRDAWDSSRDARERVLSADAARGEATRGERERERERRALFWLPRVRTSPETVMVGQIVDRIAPTHVGWERRGNKCKRSRKRNRNRGSKEIVAV